MRVEPVGARPDDDLARDRRGQRGVDQEPTRPGRSDGGHLADQGALVADDRGVEVELACEAHRARDHAPRDQRDHHAPLARRPDRGPRVGADAQVVADQRAVDVEGDEADGQDRLWGPDDGHDPMMPDRRRGRWRRPCAGRGLSRRRPSRQIRRARSGRPAAVPARSSSTGTPPAGQPLGDQCEDGVALVCPDLEEGHAITAEHLRQPIDEPADDRQPVRPPSSATGRLEARRPRQAGQDIAADVRAGSRGRGRTERTAAGSRSATSNPIRSATACPTAFSTASPSASGEMSVATMSTASSACRRRSATARATAIAPLPVPRRRSATAAVGGPSDGSPSRRMTSASASSTSRSVSGRGISARASTSKARP